MSKYKPFTITMSKSVGLRQGDYIRLDQLERRFKIIKVLKEPWYIRLLQYFQLYPEKKDTRYLVRYSPVIPE